MGREQGPGEPGGGESGGVTGAGRHEAVAGAMGAEATWYDGWLILPISLLFSVPSFFSSS